MKFRDGKNHTSLLGGRGSLLIHKCEDVKVIPECIAKLCNLIALTLDDCSKELLEKCRKPTGEDWPKIQHIPFIHILLAVR